MKLILTSHVTPIIKEVFKTINPCKSKALIIMNARDYHKPEDFRTITAEKVAEFEDAGFESIVPLDLKTYFGAPRKLQTFLEAEQPDVICAVGGDIFLLNTALHLSGFDQYLKSAPEDLVYCGSSAGAIVVSRDLTPYDIAPESADLVRERYGVAPIKTGLALIPDYVIPHLGERAFADDVKKMSQNLEALGARIRYISKNGVMRDIDHKRAI